VAAIGRARNTSVIHRAGQFHVQLRSLRLGSRVTLPRVGENPQTRVIGNRGLACVRKEHG